MKEKICVLVFITVLVCGGFAFINNIKTNLYKQALQEQKEVETYKQCILKQSQKYGWIVRSSCSSNYKELDSKANLHYIQKGLNVYLKK